MKLASIVKRYRIDKPDKFRLSDIDPDDTCGLDLEASEAKAMIAGSIKKLSDLQEVLYADDRWAMLAVFQAMDAAGKDGAIKHVMSGVNPQGCEVHAFKVPSAQELDHDFLWRTALRLPERGRIGIFNRSHYEEVLVVRVHPDLLQRQKLPQQVLGKNIWKERFQSIRNFERHLARNGMRIVKFHLRSSKEEQRKRFLERLEEPAKLWKFSMGDVKEREHWDAYMDAYEDMIRETSTGYAPWYVVPANDKWFARLVVAGAMVEALGELDLAYPKVRKSPEMIAVRDALRAEGDAGRARTKPVAGAKSKAKKRAQQSKRTK